MMTPEWFWTIGSLFRGFLTWAKTSDSLLALHAVTQDTKYVTEGFQGRSLSLYMKQAYCNG